MSKLSAQLKRIVLFLLSPLFALGYVAAFPIVALKMLVSTNTGKAQDAERTA